MTWTISQVSLLIALKEHEPIKGKTFEISDPADNKLNGSAVKNSE